MNAFLNWIVNLFYNRSDSETFKIKSIKETKKKYPSFRVVGRGTVMIDPKEICSSEKFKHDQQLASKLIKK